MTYKICTKCGETKPLVEFNVRITAEENHSKYNKMPEEFYGDT